MADLSVEEVFENDKDPMEAIREIRREEGVDENDLPGSAEDDSSQEDQTGSAKEGDDELDNLDEEQDDDETAPGDDDTNEESDNDDADDQGGEDDEADEDKPAAKTEPVKTKFKANGQEFEFSQDEIMEQFEQVFGKAMNYTQKMQDIAPYRKMISALETEGITSAQLNTAIDALKGNKDALKQLLETNKIDAYDLNDEDDTQKDVYTPTDYGKNDVQLGIEDVVKSISSDTEYKITVDVIDNQWDQTSRQSFASNPELIKGLHNDIKTGLYDEVSPMAMKMKVLDGNTKSDIEYYMLAGEKVMSEKQQKTADAEQSVTDKNKVAQDAEDDFDQASSEAQKKRSASTTRKRSDRKGVTDYLDDDDETFDAWYKDLQASN
ncbi:MAG: hypothetical protein GQ576_03520 [Methanococcoides sp.]|nr:hypothetical protein [Methanococcoides sp.]